MSLFTDWRPIPEVPAQFDDIDARKNPLLTILPKRSGDNKVLMPGVRTSQSRKESLAYIDAGNSRRPSATERYPVINVVPLRGDIPFEERCVRGGGEWEVKPKAKHIVCPRHQAARQPKA